MCCIRVNDVLCSVLPCVQSLLDAVVLLLLFCFEFFFFQAEDGIRDLTVTGVQTCALPISVYAVHHLGFREMGVLDVRKLVPAGICQGFDFEESLRRHGVVKFGSRHGMRSEEHTSELQSQSNLVCRLLLEKQNRPTPRRSPL